jgi:plasmid stabilization system protein ParE
LANIRSAVKELRQYPCKWPEGEHPGVRECPVEGYMIMYEVHPDTGDDRTAGDVEILRVFGPHQLRGRL